MVDFGTLGLRRVYDFLKSSTLCKHPAFLIRASSFRRFVMKNDETTTKLRYPDWKPGKHSVVITTASSFRRFVVKKLRNDDEITMLGLEARSMFLAGSVQNY